MDEIATANVVVKVVSGMMRRRYDEEASKRFDDMIEKYRSEDLSTKQGWIYMIAVETHAIGRRRIQYYTRDVKEAREWIRLAFQMRNIPPIVYLQGQKCNKAKRLRTHLQQDSEAIDLLYYGICDALPWISHE